MARLKPPPKAVAFDLDGTLVDTVPARIDAWVEALAEFDLRPTRAQVAALIGSGGKLVAAESARHVGVTLGTRTCEAVDRRQGEIFDALNRRPRPLPGASAVFAALDELHIPWAIATSSQPAQMRASVEALRLPHRSAIIDGGLVAAPKPAPDLLLAAARTLGAAPRRCWYVGDATWDMMAARAARMVGIGVTAGSAVGPTALRKAGATRVCKTLAGVAALLPRA